MNHLVNYNKSHSINQVTDSNNREQGENATNNNCIILHVHSPEKIKGNMEREDFIEIDKTQQIENAFNDVSKYGENNKFQNSTAKNLFGKLTPHNQEEICAHHIYNVLHVLNNHQRRTENMQVIENTHGFMNTQCLKICKNVESVDCKNSNDTVNAVERNHNLFSDSDLSKNHVEIYKDFKKKGKLEVTDEQADAFHTNEETVSFSNYPYEPTFICNRRNVELVDDEQNDCNSTYESKTKKTTTNEQGLMNDDDNNNNDHTTKNAKENHVTIKKSIQNSNRNNLDNEQIEIADTSTTTNNNYNNAITSHKIDEHTHWWKNNSVNDQIYDNILINNIKSVPHISTNNVNPLENTNEMQQGNPSIHSNHINMINNVLDWKEISIMNDEMKKKVISTLANTPIFNTVHKNHMETKEIRNYNEKNNNVLSFDHSTYGHMHFSCNKQLSENITSRKIKSFEFFMKKELPTIQMLNNAYDCLEDSTNTPNMINGYTSNHLDILHTNIIQEINKKDTNEVVNENANTCSKYGDNGNQYEKNLPSEHKQNAMTEMQLNNKENESKHEIQVMPFKDLQKGDKPKKTCSMGSTSILPKENGYMFNMRKAYSMQNMKVHETTREENLVDILNINCCLKPNQKSNSFNYVLPMNKGTSIYNELMEGRKDCDELSVNNTKEILYSSDYKNARSFSFRSLNDIPTSENEIDSISCITQNNYNSNESNPILSHHCVLPHDSMSNRSTYGSSNNGNDVKEEIAKSMQDFNKYTSKIFEETTLTSSRSKSHDMKNEQCILFQTLQTEDIAKLDQGKRENKSRSEKHAEDKKRKNSKAKTVPAKIETSLLYEISQNEFFRENERRMVEMIKVPIRGETNQEIQLPIKEIHDTYNPKVELTLLQYMDERIKEREEQNNERYNIKRNKGRANHSIKEPFDTEKMNQSQVGKKKFLNNASFNLNLADDTGFSLNNEIIEEIRKEINNEMLNELNKEKMEKLHMTVNNREVNKGSSNLSMYIIQNNNTNFNDMQELQLLGKNIQRSVGSQSTTCSTPENSLKNHTKKVMKSSCEEIPDAKYKQSTNVNNGRCDVQTTYSSSCCSGNETPSNKHFISNNVVVRLSEDNKTQINESHSVKMGSEKNNKNINTMKKGISKSEKKQKKKNISENNASLRRSLREDYKNTNYMVNNIIAEEMLNCESNAEFLYSDIPQQQIDLEQQINEAESREVVVENKKKLTISEKKKLKLERQNSKRQELYEKAKKYPKVTGVSYDRKQNIWVSHWRSQHKTMHKYFSVKKLGFECARTMAISCRRENSKRDRKYHRVKRTKIPASAGSLDEIKIIGEINHVIPSKSLTNYSIKYSCNFPEGEHNVSKEFMAYSENLKNNGTNKHIESTYESFKNESVCCLHSTNSGMKTHNNYVQKELWKVKTELDPLYGEKNCIKKPDEIRIIENGTEYYTQNKIQKNRNEAINGIYKRNTKEISTSQILEKMNSSHVPMDIEECWIETCGNEVSFDRYSNKKGMQINSLSVQNNMSTVTLKNHSQSNEEDIYSRHFPINPQPCKSNKTVFQISNEPIRCSYLNHLTADKLKELNYGAIQYCINRNDHEDTQGNKYNNFNKKKRYSNASLETEMATIPGTISCSSIHFNPNMCNSGSYLQNDTILGVDAQGNKEEGMVQDHGHVSSIMEQYNWSIRTSYDECNKHGNDVMYQSTLKNNRVIDTEKTENREVKTCTNKRGRKRSTKRNADNTLNQNELIFSKTTIQYILCDIKNNCLQNCSEYFKNNYSDIRSIIDKHIRVINKADSLDEVAPYIHIFKELLEGKKLLHMLPTQIQEQRICELVAIPI